MIKQLSKISLNNWIFIAMLLGFIVGLILNINVTDPFIKDTILIDTIFNLGGTGFIDLMKMLVVPLVFCSIVVATANLTDNNKMGGIGIKIIAFYLATTLIAVFLALSIAGIINPGDGLNMVGTQYTTNLTENITLTDTILNMIPQNPISSLANGEMIPIIIFSLIVGFLLSKLKDETKIVKQFFEQTNRVMIEMTTLVLKIAPIGVFCLMAKTFATLGISGLIPLFKFIICLVLAIGVQLLIIYPILLWALAKLNPIQFYKKFYTVMLFAFSSTSSNATIPLTLEKLSQIGVSQEVSSFSVPLGATINMDGNAIMQGCAVMFATQAYGLDLGLSAFITIIFIAFFVSISAAGVPSAAMVSLNMLFVSVGLPLDIIGVLFGIDHFCDMFRTTLNVTGDAICTTIVAYRNRAFDINIFNET